MVRLLLLGLVLVTLTFATGTSTPEAWQTVDSPLPIDDYWQLVQETRRVVRDLEGASSPARQEKLSAIAERWQDVSAVVLSDGTTVPLEHSFIVAQLRADPADLSALNELLAALVAAQEAWPQSKHPASDVEPLRQILSGSEFQWQPESRSPLEALWQQFLARFWREIARLFPEGGGGLFRGRLLAAIGALALAAVLIYALRGLLTDIVAEAEVGAEKGTADEWLTSATALKRAQTLSVDKDYRTAVRYLYLSSLLLLEERGLLRYDRSKTNREYLESVAHRPQLSAIMRDVVDVFDRVWYGFQSLDRDDYLRYEARVQELRRRK